MTFDAATNSLVLFGGSTDSGNIKLNDTWIFTPTDGWRQAFPPVSPSPRAGAGFAYDPVSKSAVLFGGGGAGNELFNDTWTWDGSTWTQQFPPVSPPPRGFNEEQMAYDAATGTIVLFGGFGADDTYFGDTWVWNGVTWAERFPASSPSPRGTTVTYDAATKQVMLFGGQGPAGFLNDTWTWDGITWSQQFPAASPSPRTNNALAYDASTGQVVLFGGIFVPGETNGDKSFSGTWMWNGATWTQLPSSVTPGALYGSCLAYFPAFKGLVLFGGYDLTNNGTNETWVLR